MAFLVSDVTAQVRMHMSDFPQDSEASALTIVNLAYSDLVAKVRLYPPSAFTIYPVANQQEYTIPSSIVRIWSARWLTSSTTQIPIIETSIDELDYENPVWRSVSPSNQPYKYYDVGGKLGFFPAPSTTVVSGYPHIELQATIFTPFTSISDPLPTFLLNVDPWVWGCCARWSAMQHHDSADYFANLALGARAELISSRNNLLTRQKPMVKASYNGPRNR